MMINTGPLLILVLALHHQQVYALFCLVKPTEYAYYAMSVTRDEMDAANCIMYDSGLQKHVFTEKYIHCDGTQLRLTDSDFGSQQYSTDDYYVWSADSMNRQLLFTFPTRVNLSTITLHYYSDSDSGKGFPRLILYAVPDDFDVWDALRGSYSNIDVAVEPPEQVQARHKKMISFNVNTRKIIMLSFNNAFEFAVSEVEFFTCNGATTTPDTMPTSVSEKNDLSDTPTSLDLTFQNTTYLVTILEVNKKNTENVELFQNSTSSNNDLVESGNLQIKIVLPVVTLVAIVVTVVIVALLTFLYRKRNSKLKTNVELDTIYSTLNRGTKQQLEPQSLDTSAELYDQIQLSPFTGQTEHISKTESKSSNSLTSPSTSVYLNMVKKQEGDKEMSNTEYATYAVVDKKKKKSRREESKERQENTSEKGVPLKSTESLTTTVPIPEVPGDVEKPKDQQSQRKEKLEETYAVVQKKPKKREEEETAPPIPSYSVEALYTAVQKKPK